MTRIDVGNPRVSVSITRSDAAGEATIVAGQPTLVFSVTAEVVNRDARLPIRAGPPAVDASAGTASADASATATAGSPAVAIGAESLSRDASVTATAGTPEVAADATATSADHEAEARTGLPSVSISASTLSADASTTITAGSPVVEAVAEGSLTLDASAEAIAGNPSVTASARETSADHEAEARAGTPAVEATATADILDQDAAVEATAGAPSVTAEADTPPLELNISDWDGTGYQPPVVLALVQIRISGDQITLNPVTAIQGELQVAADLTIARVRRFSPPNAIRLHRTGTGLFSASFGASGTYPEADLFIQSVDGVQTYDSGSQGRGFSNWRLPTGGDNSFLADLVDNDLAILAIAEPIEDLDATAEITAGDPDVTASAVSEDAAASVSAIAGLPTVAATAGAQDINRDASTEITSGSPTVSRRCRSRRRRCRSLRSGSYRRPTYGRRRGRSAGTHQGRGMPSKAEVLAGDPAVTASATADDATATAEVRAGSPTVAASALAASADHMIDVLAGSADRRRRRIRDVSRARGRYSGRLPLCHRVRHGGRCDRLGRDQGRRSDRRCRRAGILCRSRDRRASPGARPWRSLCIVG